MPRRIRIGGQRGSRGGVSWRMPRLEVELPTREDLAADAARRAKVRTESQLRAGRDAHGARKALAPATIARRKKKPGSLGGSVPFVDTGRLVGGLRVVTTPSGAELRVSGDRVSVVAELEARGRPPLTLRGEDLEGALRAALRRALR